MKETQNRNRKWNGIALGLLLSIFLSIFFSTPIPTSASEDEAYIVKTSIPYGYTLLFANDAPYIGYSMPMFIKESNGAAAFCAEPAISTFGNNTYKAQSAVGSILRGYSKELDWTFHSDITLTAALLDKAKMVIYHGWNNSQKTEVDYAATQLLVWQALTNCKIEGISSTVSARISEIRDLVEIHGLRPDFSGEGYDSSTNTLTIEVGQRVTLTDQNNVIGKMSQVENSTNLEVQVLDDTLILTATKDSEDGSLSFVKWDRKSPTDASLIYISPIDDQRLLEASDPDVINFGLNVIMIKNGAIEFTKTAEGKDFDGATFALTKDGQPVGLEKLEEGHYKASDDGSNSFKTSNGKALLEDLPEGSYTVTETATDEHFVLDSTPLNIQVNPGQTSTGQMDNKAKLWKAQVQKEDKKTGTAQGDATLEGAVYGIYQDGKLLDRYTTDKDGRFETKTYKTGPSYTLKEIKPSPGYLLDETVYPIPADAKNFKLELNTIELKVKEEVQKGFIEIIKHTDDGSTQIETPETGASFEVFLKKAESYDKAKETERDLLLADERGYAKSKNLPYGTYIVKQTQSWPGRELMAPFDVTISEDGQRHSFIINNNNFEAFLKIVKLDSETGRIIPLAGAGFEIYDPSGERVVQKINYPSPQVLDTFYTDESGTLTLPKALPYGTNYSLVEVKAPTDYVLDTEPVFFDVTPENTSRDGEQNIYIEIKKENKAQKGHIQILKTGQTFATVEESEGLFRPIFQEQGLKGALYEIYAAEDVKTPDGTVRYAKDTLVDTIRTDETGQGQSQPLYLGKYLLVEKEAPQGYVLDKEAHPISLTYAGQEISITSVGLSASNQLQEISLSLKKALEEDFHFTEKVDIRDVCFGLYAGEDIVAADGSKIPQDGKIESLMVKADGSLSYSGKLPFGKYYLLEEKTAEGYLLNNNAIEFEFHYQGQNVDTFVLRLLEGTALENKLIRGKIEGLKIDNETHEAIAGVTFGLFKEAQEFPDIEKASYWTKTDDEGRFSFQEIPYGTWFLQEIEAKPGYINHPEAKEIHIQENGVLLEFTWENEKTTTLVSKIELGSNEALPGAKLAVLDKNGQIVDEWVSTKEPHVIRALTVGETYTLRELEAPEGYEKAKDKNFAISKEGTTHIKLENVKPVIQTGDSITGGVLLGLCVIPVLPILLFIRKRIPKSDI